MRSKTRLPIESVNLNRAFHKPVAALPITQICDDLFLCVAAGAPLSNLSPPFRGERPKPERSEGFG